ncbi:MAG: DNA-deoxyinosine glycosylase [Pseudomonadota bacterium]|nr:DNA-deoxyinosine glycosylase [Pseudomonadota bacterium]
MISGFKPIINQQTRLLVLGTMPSVSSIQEQFYYAHPRNAFWWIIAQLVNEPVEHHHLIQLPQKYAWLKQLRLGLWDVLAQCQREGSLDSAIVRSSEQANDFATLFAQYPTIDTIICNGQTAHKLLYRHVDASLYQNKRVVTLPSTSPANARLCPEQKLKRWQEVIQAS